MSKPRRTAASKRRRTSSRRCGCLFVPDVRVDVLPDGSTVAYVWPPHEAGCPLVSPQKARRPAP
jgi:hypothetical protein